MSVEHVDARPGAHAGSVTLTQVSVPVRAGDRVTAALIRMITGLTLENGRAASFTGAPTSQARSSPAGQARSRR